MSYSSLFLGVLSRLLAFLFQKGLPLNQPLAGDRNRAEYCKKELADKVKTCFFWKDEVFPLEEGFREPCFDWPLFGD